MKKFWLLSFLILSLTTTAQTLFTYGNQQVSTQEFLRAYNKNNTQPVANKKQVMKDYLELYINSRLKIREAYELGYDTLPQIRSEVSNLRNQIVENYMSDPETMRKLIAEAFARSQKDVHVGHIFIPIQNLDTPAAYSLAQSVYNRLQKGEDFGKLAQDLSQAPNAKADKGDIGWITVFTLPYAFENAIYTLAPSKISTPVRSKAGYHIFKNLGERKALGKMKARQILIAIPPGTDEAGKKQLARKADSIYKRIVAGEDFAKLASTVSNDYLTAVTGGSMPDFGVGQYEPAFESKVWALKKDNEVSKPFETSHGFHIVKRLSIVPVVTDPANKINEQDLKSKVNQDQRWKTSRDVIFNKVVKQAGLKRNDFDNASLWVYTDSMLDRKPLGIGKTFTPVTALYKLGDTVITAENWTGYAAMNRFRQDGTGRRLYEDVMNDYVQNFVFSYYRSHLEQFNEEFRNQMNEFKDGNLFFEIMQQEIWNRAQTDSAELIALYEKNKSKYSWNKSADAVLFYVADDASAKTLHAQLKKDPRRWKELAESMMEKVVADSARFEWTQIPNKNKMALTNGMITTPVLNPTDNSTSFAYVIKVYTEPMPRSFNEAKGLVINDYQALLEEKWLAKLKAKYPVTVDWKVFDSIAK